MNGATTDSTTIPVSKRSSSSRLPADGDEVKKFHESVHFPEPYKNWNMECQSKTLCGEITECSAKSVDCMEASSNPSPSACYKWAQSLQCLLEDSEGVNLFEKFLKQEGQDTKYLTFLFACRGMKKQYTTSCESLFKLIKVIFEKRVKRISAISDETKEEIKQKLSLNKDVDNTIFDKAMRDVEAHMMKTTYPNFLRSDLYIQYFRECQDELSPEKECAFTTETAVAAYLPTVHEDAELQISSNKIPPLTKSNILLRYKISSTSSSAPLTSKLKPEGPGFLQSPYTYYNYHTRYNSVLPASAQDSELQSLSSDALTDDTMSIKTDSNADVPMCSRSKQQKRPQKTSKHNSNIIINKDKCSREPDFIPRTQRFEPPKPDPLSPEFHELLCKKLFKVVEERKTEEKMHKVIESAESHVMSQLFASMEENDQDILDQHISRVFDNGGRNIPVSGCTSPMARPADVLEKSRVHLQNSSGCPELSNSYAASHKHNQVSHFTVPNKYRRDHDNQSPDSALYDNDYHERPVDYSRRSKDNSKRNMGKRVSSMTDSSSSFVDSGISVACESVPSYSKVSHWLETKRTSEQERDHFMWRNSCTSPDLTKSSRKVVYNSGIQDVGCSQWSSSSQLVSQDMPMIGHSHSDVMSNELRRRLEDENRTKIKSRKPNRKSCSLNAVEAATTNAMANDVTVIGYSFGRCSVPYLSKVPGKNITLRQFKNLLSKKGNFRYFFKKASNDFGTGVVFEEVNEDHKVLPLWEGKVFCVIESMDDNCIM